MSQSFIRKINIFTPLYINPLVLFFVHLCFVKSYISQCYLSLYATIKTFGKPYKETIFSHGVIQRIVSVIKLCKNVKKMRANHLDDHRVLCLGSCVTAQEEQETRCPGLVQRLIYPELKSHRNQSQMKALRMTRKVQHCFYFNVSLVSNSGLQVYQASAVTT